MGMSNKKHNPRPLVFLTCSLLIFLVAPHLTGVVKAASVGQPVGTHLGSTVSAGAGHISGQLLDGSRNNAPVANQSVTLQMAQGNNARDLLSITTDAQGRYAFGALESDSSVQYAIYTLYEGAQYFTDPISLNKKPDQQINLTVYDATTSAANLAVIQASILIDKPNTQAGTLTISEDFVFENLGDTTYVGAVNGSHGKPNALSFSLPLGARFLSLSNGFNGYTGTQINGGFASNAAVPPGTSEFSFSFQVPYSGTGYHFVYQAIYPTVSLSLLTPTSFSVLPQQGLTAKGPSNTQSGTYSLFEAQKLSAGKSVQAQLGGLPVPAKATPAQQSQIDPLLLWLVGLLILLLILAGIGGYFYNTRRRRARLAKRKQELPARKGATSGKKATIVTTKEALLREMLELDKAYEAGKMKKAAYQEQRARLKARLRNLMDEQPVKRGEAASKAARSGSREEK